MSMLNKTFTGSVPECHALNLVRFRVVIVLQSAFGFKGASFARCLQSFMEAWKLIACLKY